MKRFKSMQMFRLSGSGEQMGLIWSYLDGQYELKEFAEELQERLAEFPVQDPSGSQWSQMGFVPPVDYSEDLAFIPAHSRVVLLCIETRSRILPGPTLRKAVEVRVEKLEQNQGRKLSRKERAELREDEEAVLLPRAFVKASRVHVAIDGDRVFVFSSSAKVAEDVTALIRKAVGSFPTNYLVNAFDMANLLTAVLRDGEYSSERYGQIVPCMAATLEASEHEGGRIALKDEDLSDERVSGLLKEGYQCIRLAAQVSSHPGESTDKYFRATIGAGGGISGVKFSDVILSTEENGDYDEDDRHIMDFESSFLLAVEAWRSFYDLLAEYHTKDESTEGSGAHLDISTPAEEGGREKEVDF